jgi:hypothetical protein
MKQQNYRHKSMHLTKTDQEMLEFLVQHMEISESMVIRTLIIQEYGIRKKQLEKEELFNEAMKHNEEK